MKPLFCDTAHHRIIPPKWLFNANIKSERGITISCGVPNCKGKVKVKIKPTPMTREEKIKKVLMTYPAKLELVNDVRFTKFGYYYIGIGDAWVWYNKEAKTKSGEQRFNLNEESNKRGHYYLQDASDKEIDLLFSMIGNELYDDSSSYDENGNWNLDLALKKNKPNANTDIHSTEQQSAEA